MRTKKAQSLIDYALIFGLVMLIAVGVLYLIGQNVGSVFSEETQDKTNVQQLK